MIHDFLIVGAGLAGLKAAHDLHAAGRKVLLLDKGRGVGGRAATRRWDGVPVDHGAQFFTVRFADFQGMVNRWKAHRVCFEWAGGFHQWDDDNRGLRAPGEDGGEQHPRYACREGMSALAKNLVGALPRQSLRLQTRATALRWHHDHWQLAVDGPEAANQPVPAGRTLVLALPVPQILALLGDPAEAERSPFIHPDALRRLRATEYAPTLAVLLRGPADAPEWRGIQLRDHTLSWISDDSGKREPQPAPGQNRVFVLHAGADFSRQWQDADLDEAARRMVARAGEIVGDWITQLPDRQMHRWRYANVPKGIEDGAALRGTGSAGAPIYFAGDAFLGAKIEGACRSGLELARALLKEK